MGQKAAAALVMMACQASERSPDFKAITKACGSLVINAQNAGLDLLKIAALYARMYMPYGCKMLSLFICAHAWRSLQSSFERGLSAAMAALCHLSSLL